MRPRQIILALVLPLLPSCSQHRQQVEALRCLRPIPEPAPARSGVVLTPTRTPTDAEMIEALRKLEMLP